MKRRIRIASSLKLILSESPCWRFGVGSLQYVLERGQSDDWFTDNTIVMMTILAGTGLISFVWRQLTIANPMNPA